MDKATKKQVFNIDKSEKETQITRKIMDPNRDINKLLENQVTPTTIKILMGQFHKTSLEYKRLEKEYRSFLLQKNMRPGVIRIDDYKKNGKWEEKKAKSYFISTNYRVEKKTPLDIMKEKKQRKNQTNMYDLSYEPYKEIYEEQIEEIDQEFEQEQHDEVSKSVKINKKEKNYRTSNEEVDIIRANRPAFSHQISELKHHGLSVVDFVLESDEEINVIKEENELTIELIKNPLNDDQIDRTEFVSNVKKPVEKQVTVKLVRKTAKPSITPTVSLNNKDDIVNKKPSIINNFNTNTFVDQNGKKPIINRPYVNPGITDLPIKVGQSQSNYQDNLTDLDSIEEKKQPKFVQEIAAKKRLEKYVNGLKKQQDKNNSISLRKELGELNRLVNQEKLIKFGRDAWQENNNGDENKTDDKFEIAPKAPINSLHESQINTNNDNYVNHKENENEEIDTFEKQPKFVQEIETKKRFEKYVNDLKQKRISESNISLKDEIKELNNLIQQEGKISSDNQILDDQIQKQRKISDSLFAQYNQLTEQEEEMQLYLLRKLKLSDNNVNKENLLEQNEEYQLLLRLKNAIEHNEKSLVNSLKRQVELSQIIKSKHS